MNRAYLALFSVGIVGAALVGYGSADACSREALEPHTLDPAEQSSDHVPPDKAAVTACEISRRFGPQSAGCGKTASSSCDPEGTVHLEVTATDDRTDAARIGYRLEIVAGALPAGLQLPADAIRARDGSVYLPFADEEPGSQESISFSVRAVAVDLAGNESDASDPVKCTDPGDD